MSLPVHALPLHMLTSFSVDKILLPKYMNWFTNFRGIWKEDGTILIKTHEFRSIWVHASYCLLQNSNLLNSA